MKFEESNFSQTLAKVEIDEADAVSDYESTNQLISDAFNVVAIGSVFDVGDSFMQISVDADIKNSEVVDSAKNSAKTQHSDVLAQMTVTIHALERDKSRLFQ